MTFFHRIRIRGETYDFDHLRPHQFDLIVEDKSFRVEVHYSSHVFTEGLTDSTTPDLYYQHSGECRAFCLERYLQSKKLPEIISSHDRRYVYHTFQNNYFLVTSAVPQPYYVFFRPRTASRRPGVSVVIKVVSAYAKEKEKKFAPAIRFARLVKLYAEGKKIKQGNSVRVRIRQ